uniref:Uncharacterized protein n=1 Tax=Vibrio crassostreae TaxID=246167 RepID=A0A0H3ZX30_9VIBR|nr:hypothetical protein [Vibrio crassostreae]
MRLLGVQTTNTLDRVFNMKVDVAEIIIFIAKSQILSSKQKQNLATQVANYLALNDIH